MLFNSFSFLIFFPLVTLVFFLIRTKVQWVWLLMASCYFYMSFVPHYILILFLLILIDYYAGILIENAREETKKRFLILSLIANIGLLFFFKYYNFLAENVENLYFWTNISSPLPQFNIILPIGLSFHTFQSMSYTIEVYRGNQKAERHLGIYALYVLFYPQMVAGPIERPQNLLHQFKITHAFDLQSCIAGIHQMLWGFFKKVVIADRLALIVNPVYEEPTRYTGIPLILATYFFSFQIYCDFSGYSDIAIGAARVMGFKLMTNFDRPYFSKSISEFWRRWHISLSTWFKDYLYIPIGGSRRKFWRWQLNLMIVFIISGLWHGANWTFIIWGMLHGLYLVIENLLAKVKHAGQEDVNRGHFWFKALCVFFVFNLVSFAWIFFRASSLKDAVYIVTHLLVPSEFSLTRVSDFFNVSLFDFLTTLFLLILMESVEIMQKNTGQASAFFHRKPVALRWMFYYLVILVILVFGKFSEQNFIYFQF
jgi:alginate O-acetyltransferase complex protein AlgI